MWGRVSVILVPSSGFVLPLWSLGHHPSDITVLLVSRPPSCGGRGQPVPLALPALAFWVVGKCWVRRV